MSANASLDWLMKPFWSWVKSLPNTRRNSERSQCKWAAQAVIHPLAQRCQVLSEPVSGWLMLAHSSPRQVQGAGATEEAGLPFLFANRETGTVWSIEEGKAWKDRLWFSSSGTDCFKTTGNKWCNESQLFPHSWVHCCYHKSSYLWFQFAVTSLSHSLAI